MFTEEDAEAVLEYMREKALLCSGCGLPKDETMAFENQFAYEAEPYRCHACAAVDRKSAEIGKGPNDPGGRMYSIKFREDKVVKRRSP